MPERNCGSLCLSAPGNNWIDAGTLARCRSSAPGTCDLIAKAMLSARYCGKDAIDKALDMLDSGEVLEITPFGTDADGHPIDGESEGLDKLEKLKNPLDPTKLPKGASQGERLNARMEAGSESLDSKANAVAYAIDSILENADKYVAVRNCRDELRAMAPKIRGMIPLKMGGVLVRILWWLNKADSTIQYGGITIVGIGHDPAAIFRQNQQPSLRNPPPEAVRSRINQDHFADHFWEPVQTLIWETTCEPLFY